MTWIPEHDAHLPQTLLGSSLFSKQPNPGLEPLILSKRCPYKSDHYLLQISLNNINYHRSSPIIRFVYFKKRAMWKDYLLLYKVYLFEKL